MPDRTFTQFSYNGGEVSERLGGRFDQGLYAVACEGMLGWRPTLQGPAVTCLGTRLIARAKGPCRLLPFEYNPTQGYVVEASEGALRLYTNDLRIETSPGVAYEVAHPYTLAQLADIDPKQSFDVSYWVGGGMAPHQLTRHDALNFTFDLVDLRNGPIGDSNSDPDVTVGVSATTGTISLYASAPTFNSDQVGALFEIEAADHGDVGSWDAGMSISAGAKRAWDGRVYSAQTGGRTGSNPPIHDSGSEWDGSGSGTDINSAGPYGVKWLFLYGRVGLARITGVTNSTTATATVIKRLSDSLVSYGSWRWALGAFSDDAGWPDGCELWAESLVLFRRSSVYVSVVGDLTDFDRRDGAGDFQRDLSGSFTLPSTAQIRWARADRLLVVGTDKTQFTVERPLVTSQSASPPLFEIKLQGTEGVSTVPPVQAAGRLLFPQRAKRRLLEMGYAFSSDRYTAPDLSRLAPHITAKGIVERAWTAEPDRTLWLCLEDGTLAGLVYDPDQQVMGWFRRELGGGLKARSITSITDPTGNFDQLWIAAETPAGDWLVLLADKPLEEGDDWYAANLLDAAISYNGAPVSSGTGATHLAGMTAYAIADGVEVGEITIANDGSWSIPSPASAITIGLMFEAQLDLLPPVMNDGTGLAKPKRIKEISLELVESAGLQVSVQGQEAQLVDLRTGGETMDGAPEPFSGTTRLATVGAFDLPGRVRISRALPRPSVLLAHRFVAEVAA